MAKFMLLGGGNVGRGTSSYQTKIIDEEIVKMTKKETPMFLFVGLASGFSDSYYDTMKKIYRELGCSCIYLKKKNILNNPNLVREKIFSADIIYFGGGDTLKLVQEMKQYGVDLLLTEVIKKDVVIAGMSAGAIMLCKEGYSDSLILRNESDRYDFIEGLNYLNISFCPHYNNNGSRYLELKADLVNSDRKVVAVEDGAALKIEDNRIEVVRSIEGAKAYNCYYDEGKFIEAELVTKDLY